MTSPIAPSTEATTPRGISPFVWVTLILGAIAAGLYFYFAQNGLRISIGKDALQTRIDQRMPFIGVRGPLHYSLNTALLDLRADGRVGVDAGIGLQVLNRTVEARVTGSGRLEYRDGDFFLYEIAVEDVALAEAQPGAAPDPRARLRQILESKLRNVASGALRQLEEELRKHGGAVLGAALDRYPVYRLKQEDHKQALAKMVLDKIEVRDQTLIVTLSVAARR